jgi:hypothetical protein
MKNISDKRCRENQNTHFEFSNFVSENRAFYEIMWKNIVEADRPQMATWRTRFAFWIHKAANTHSEYVTTIAFPLQQWLHERASVLCYSYIACLVFSHPFLRFLLCEFDTWGYVNM